MTFEPNATGLPEIGLGDANIAHANYVPDASEGSPLLRLVNGTVVQASQSGAGTWLSDWSPPAAGNTLFRAFATSNDSGLGWDFGRDVDAHDKLAMAGTPPLAEPRHRGGCCGGWPCEARRAASPSEVVTAIARA